MDNIYFDIPKLITQTCLYYFCNFQIPIPSIAKCKFIVGKILKIEDHSQSDLLYILNIDIGKKEEKRQIVCGIKKYITKKELIYNPFVVIFANIKPIKFRGVESFGMILAAINNNRTKLEIVRPPYGSKIGERILIENENWNIYDIKTYEMIKGVKYHHE